MIVIQTCLDDYTEEVRQWLFTLRKSDGYTWDFGPTLRADDGRDLFDVRFEREDDAIMFRLKVGK